MVKPQLREKFYNGLLTHGIKKEDIPKLTYCGGNRNSHLNYFKDCFPDRDVPLHVSVCPCGKRDISENCYIHINGEITVSGNCCIKQFIDQSGRTCKYCMAQHHNQKDNTCNTCREKKKQEEREQRKEERQRRKEERQRLEEEWQRLEEERQRVERERKREQQGMDKMLCSIIMFGKYLGKTYQEVYETDRPYLHYLMEKGFFSNDQYPNNKYIRLLLK